MDPNRINSGTTATENLPAVLLSVPSLTKIFVICPNFYCALRRFRSTAGQSSSVDNDVSPKYWNEETTVSGVPYSKNT